MRDGVGILNAEVVPPQTVAHFHAVPDGTRNESRGMKAEGTTPLPRRNPARIGGWYATYQTPGNRLVRSVPKFLGAIWFATDDSDQELAGRRGLIGDGD